MNGAWPEIADGALMFGRGVAFVAGETIAGILRVEFRHQSVAEDFRDDGSRGDGKIDAIAFVETVLRLRESGNGPAVHENVLWRDGQVRKRHLHGANARVIDVEPVDLINFHDAQGE